MCSWEVDSCWLPWNWGEFLSNNNIIDYSLLLGIHEKDPKDSWNLQLWFPNFRPWQNAIPPVFVLWRSWNLMKCIETWMWKKNNEIYIYIRLSANQIRLEFPISFAYKLCLLLCRWSKFEANKRIGWLWYVMIDIYILVDICGFLLEIAARRS